MNENVSGSNKITCNAILLSGCKDIQFSADAYKLTDKYDYSGAFTTALLQSCQKKYIKLYGTLVITMMDFQPNCLGLHRHWLGNWRFQFQL